jgi:hypothetical protein
MIIDATCKKRAYARRHSLPPDALERARRLVARLLPG